MTTHLPSVSNQSTALSIRLSNTLLATTKKILGGSGLLEMTSQELWAWWQNLSDEWKFLILQQGLESKLWGDETCFDDYWFFDETYNYQAEFDWNNQSLMMSFLHDLKSKKHLSFDLKSLQKNHPLKDLCYLTGISLSIIHIDDPDVFIGLNNLTKLSFLQRHQTINVQFLRKAHYLKKITLDYGNIENIDGLSYLINLQSLSLNHNHIFDISPLKFLDKLEFLSISHNQLSDITLLSELKNLLSLDLSCNQISTIDSLSHLNQLKTLYLNNNRIITIDALLELKELQFLSLENNPIAQDEIQKLQQSLPNCLIFHSNFGFL